MQFILIGKMEVCGEAQVILVKIMGLAGKVRFE